MSFAESIARITRAQAETETLAAEARKFVSEAPKIGVEPKLLRVSRHVTPVAVVIGALAALTAAAPVLLKIAR